MDWRLEINSLMRCEAFHRERLRQDAHSLVDLFASQNRLFRIAGDEQNLDRGAGAIRRSVAMISGFPMSRRGRCG
jgi:hypothetical protein